MSCNRVFQHQPNPNIIMDNMNIFTTAYDGRTYTKNYITKLIIAAVEGYYILPLLLLIHLYHQEIVAILSASQAYITGASHLIWINHK